MEKCLYYFLKEIFKTKLGIFKDSGNTLWGIEGSFGVAFTCKFLDNT